MRPLRHLTALLVVAVVAAGCGDSATNTSAPGDDGERPNIVLIFVDDMRAHDLEYGFGRSLDDWDSALVRHLVDEGTTFENYIHNTPLCCPSRASAWTGRYAHGHGVYQNNYHPSRGNGGWRRFWEQGYVDDTIAVWMQDSGYRTALVGKFMNGYPDDPDGFVPPNYVAPGWDEFEASIIKASDFSFYEFDANENGTIVHHGPGAYLTDWERDNAVDFIRRAAPGGPFFLYLAPYAPHAPSEAAPRHAGMHDEFSLDDPPSFNETDLGDKPQWVADSWEERGRWWGGGANARLDMTLALDEMIDAVVGELEAQGVLDETYVFFVSDNGLVVGEHGIGGKSAAYEESIRTPMLVRGPGVATGETYRHLVGTIDLAPTLLALAGAPIPTSIDGESLVGVLGGEVAEEAWRDGILVELEWATDSPNQPGEIPAYEAVRTLDHTYVEYATGERELYDLAADPYQLDSMHDSAPPELLAELQDLVAGMRGCSGDGCAAGARLAVANEPGIVHHCKYDVCTFEGLPAAGRPGEPTAYRWDFGDGTFADGREAAHTYTRAGLHLVTLTVVYPDGEEATSRFVPATFRELFVRVLDVSANPRVDAGDVAARVEVLDDREIAVADAQVQVVWRVDGVDAGGGSATSRGDGRASLTFTGATSGATIEVCVVDIIHPTLRYEPSRNARTCAETLFP